ncbi:MAG: melibiose:sodium transporter MelB [Romboutsia timonensis]|uniref:melibiose:sodium transporter MelB n=1 Tax=Romboutsia timonensis TaxID=1776391 RepID=UPI0039944E0F
MQKLTSREKYSYGIGAYGKDLACGIVYTFLMIYFTDVVGINPAFVGTLFLMARLWDAINDPIMGMIVDNTRSRFGKFRPWIFIGTILNSVVLFLLFRKPDLEGTSLYLYYSVMYILWGMTYTIMDIPYWSMIPTLATTKEDREKISVVPRIFASLGGLTVTTFGIALVNKLGNGNQIKGFEYFALGIIIIFIISTIVTCINVKEKTQVQVNNEKVNIKQAFNILKQNDQLLVFIGIVLAYNLAMQLAGGAAIYYFKYVAGKESLFSVYSFFKVAEIGGLMLFPVVTRKIGRQQVFRVATILPMFGLITLFISGLIAPQSILFISVSAVLLNLGSGFLLGSTTVMLADIVDYGEYKLGSRNESIIFSAQTLLVKLASALSGWLIGVGLSLIGYVAGAAVQSNITIIGIRVIMTIIPSIVALVMYVIYKSKYKINGSFHDEILQVIGSRKKVKVLDINNK